MVRILLISLPSSLRFRFSGLRWALGSSITMAKRASTRTSKKQTTPNASAPNRNDSTGDPAHITPLPEPATDTPRHRVLTPCIDPSLLAPEQTPPSPSHAPIPTIDYAALMAEVRVMQGDYLRLVNGIMLIQSATERLERAEAAVATHTPTAQGTSTPNGAVNNETVTVAQEQPGSVPKPKGSYGGGKKGFHLQAEMGLVGSADGNRQYKMILVRRCPSSLISILSTVV